jgi:hypothetical protein
MRSIRYHDALGACLDELRAELDGTASLSPALSPALPRPPASPPPPPPAPAGGGGAPAPAGGGGGPHPVPGRGAGRPAPRRPLTLLMPVAAAVAAGRKKRLSTTARPCGITRLLLVSVMLCWRNARPCSPSATVSSGRSRTHSTATVMSETLNRRREGLRPPPPLLPPPLPLPPPPPLPLPPPPPLPLPLVLPHVLLKLPGCRPSYPLRNVQRSRHRVRALSLRPKRRLPLPLSSLHVRLRPTVRQRGRRAVAAGGVRGSTRCATRRAGSHHRAAVVAQRPPALCTAREAAGRQVAAQRLQGLQGMAAARSTLVPRRRRLKRWHRRRPRQWRPRRPRRAFLDCMWCSIACPLAFAHPCALSSIGPALGRSPAASAVPPVPKRP